MKKLIAAGAVAVAALGLTAGTASALGDTSKTIAELAVADGNFTTLLTAVAAADPAVLAAVDECTDAPVTVFAPTDAAFAAIPADTLTAVLADQALLTDILLYHVLPTKVMSTDLPAGSTTVTMANGDSLDVTVDGGVMLNGTVTVTVADIEACNGVIHVIDAVLMPPADAPTDTTLAAEMPSTGLKATTGYIAAALLGVGSLFAFGARRRVTA